MKEPTMRRLRTIMTPEDGNPLEASGVLNPAAARGPDGELYLLPRLVAKGNYSRIGIAHVKFGRDGEPEEVERMGVVLEPEAEYELRPDGGGCEDARVVFVEPLKCYFMTYTGFSAHGPRIALAHSEDLLHWERFGLAKFSPFRGIEFAGVDDKDASVFPVAVPNHLGKPEMALVHRPLFPGTRPEETVHTRNRKLPDVDHESIWISYRPMVLDGSKMSDRFDSHHRLASPVAPWERLKIGGGTPPVLTRHGWMIVYHGVSDGNSDSANPRHLSYSAGIMILSKDHPHKIVYRSANPLLVPELPDEKIGTIGDVVFPTGIDRRDDLDDAEQFDVYYGMADDRIGVARLELPYEFSEPAAEHKQDAAR
jgi:predicted GH43/DUF377 family glycosyl hydrolase